ncbi:hypothetical protein JVT61DRAFT_9059 [Boletus reticuloceps]|uniref:Uncharacterized protein n=1 Tax=Boletus reticuloceps TaxID=495285 RepID=A0A8I2YDD6_9AGAM|nr:hypothetical protein JVT61DRAFT_12576 [Boletus reticuloceps]KAG6371715.1 hypothetical protein JVT61DRAFT_9059 [Boletus reticuloceps]
MSSKSARPICSTLSTTSSRVSAAPSERGFFSPLASQNTSLHTLRSHVFGPRLEVSNSPELVLAQGNIAMSPEYALGRT